MLFSFNNMERVCSNEATHFLRSTNLTFQMSILFQMKFGTRDFNLYPDFRFSTFSYNTPRLSVYTLIYPQTYLS